MLRNDEIIRLRADKTYKQLTSVDVADIVKTLIKNKKDAEFKPDISPALKLTY